MQIPVNIGLRAFCHNKTYVMLVMLPADITTHQISAQSDQPFMCYELFSEKSPKQKNVYNSRTNNQVKLKFGVWEYF